jgi:hypothetical protein
MTLTTLFLVILRFVDRDTWCIEKLRGQCDDESSMKVSKIISNSVLVLSWNLKVLTNEKRGGMKVVAFDRSPFKIFLLRFSTKSCERPKTTQRSLYDMQSGSLPDTIALLGINYCLQIIETGFAEQFYVSHRMGPAPFCLKIAASTT